MWAWCQSSSGLPTAQLQFKDGGRNQPRVFASSVTVRDSQKFRIFHETNTLEETIYYRFIGFSFRALWKIH